MLVETYEVPEVDAMGTPECEAEAIELIESLGLEGQQSLLKKSGGETVRMPYRKMTAEEAFVYEKVLPKKTKLQNYSDGPIPLRVLQVASHAKELYDLIQVWHPENADEKDPVLVGVNGSEYSAKERFMLARWGEELLPFSELAKKAGAKVRAEIKAACATGIAKLKACADSLDELSDADLAAAQKPIPWTHHTD